jgi:hypothetical protein
MAGKKSLQIQMTTIYFVNHGITPWIDLFRGKSVNVIEAQPDETMKRDCEGIYPEKGVFILTERSLIRSYPRHTARIARMRQNQWLLGYL